MDKLLAEHFLGSGHSRAQSYCKHLSWKIPELQSLCIRTVSIGPIHENESRDLL